MKIIQRYIAQHVILSTALVFFVILALSFIVQLLGELRDIGVGDYGFWQAVVHVGLTLPHMLYQFFPMLVLLGGVLGLGSLASSNELIVMRAAGVSIGRIIGAVICAALVLIVLAAILGEGIAPRADFIAGKQKANAQSAGQAMATTSGLWVHEKNNFLHIERVIKSHHLEGVTRYEFNDQHRLLAAYFATFLEFEKGHWVAHDLVKTTLTHDHSQSQTFTSATWNLILPPNLLRGGLMEPGAMSLWKLGEYSDYLVQNHLQANQFLLAFWDRAFQPLMTLVMILLAVPFVFAAPRSINMGVRLLLAVMMGFAFYILNTLLGQLSIVLQIPAFFAALFPTLLFAIIGYVLMIRVTNS